MDGKNGFIGNPGSGKIGECLFTDCLGGMDDPREAGLAEKNRNSRKLACRRFVVSPPHSPGDCIQAPLYPCPSVPFDSIAPALSPFGPTMGCSLTCIAPDASPPRGQLSVALPSACPSLRFSHPP